MPVVQLDAVEAVAERCIDERLHLVEGGTLVRVAQQMEPEPGATRVACCDRLRERERAVETREGPHDDPSTRVGEAIVRDDLDEAAQEGGRGLLFFDLQEEHRPVATPCARCEHVFERCPRSLIGIVVRQARHARDVDDVELDDVRAATQGVADLGDRLVDAAGGRSRLDVTVVATHGGGAAQRCELDGSRDARVRPIAERQWPRVGAAPCGPRGLARVGLTDAAVRCPSERRAARVAGTIDQALVGGSRVHAHTVAVAGVGRAREPVIALRVGRALAQGCVDDTATASLRATVHAAAVPIVADA